MTPDMMTDNLARAQDTIARLTAELTAANQRAAASVEAVVNAVKERDALVAAAYEAAAKIGDKLAAQNGPLAERGMNKDYQAGLSSGGQAVASAIRALSHPTAALDRIKARDAALVEVSLKFANSNLPNKTRMEKLVLSLREPASPPADAQADFPEVSLEAVAKAQAEINERFPAIGSGRLVEVEETAQVTVREAALVALSSAVRQRDMEAACDALDKFDAALGRALRAIAGGRDE